MLQNMSYWHHLINNPIENKFPILDPKDSSLSQEKPNLLSPILSQLIPVYILTVYFQMTDL
jgi:hypothetical protein